MAALSDRVLQAAAAWVWVPPDADAVVTDEYRLTHYPERTCVHSSTTSRPVAEVVGEVRAAARAAGRERLQWWVKPTTVPTSTADDLLALGFRVHEHLDVLGLDLHGGAADAVARLEVPGDVEVHPVDDEEGLGEAGRLSAAVFADAPPTPAQVAEALAAVEAGRATGRYDRRQFVARLDGAVVGHGGMSLVDGVVRLWGAAVLPAARGRGAYRALLAARLGFGAAQGADVVLVKARPGTSGPVLRRAGFVRLGEETGYELAGTP